MSHTREAIRTALVGILQEETAVDLPAISDDTTLRDLGLTSVDLVGAVIRVEQQYNIRFTYADMQQLTNIGQLINLIQAKTAAAAA